MGINDEWPKPDRHPLLRLWYVARFFLVALGIGALIVIGLVASTLKPWSKPSKVASYAFPFGTRIEKEDGTDTDPFGDFAYCAIVHLEPEQVALLKKHGLEWMDHLESRDLPTVLWRSERVKIDDLNLLGSEAKCEEMIGKTEFVGYTKGEVEGYLQLFIGQLADGRFYFHRVSS